ncbi:Dabb family protein [Paenibacillus sp. GCM10012306]|uniref:Dabb family protein n=1 Tax=Paenibacillus sp. GCM10012306 TaxID=3317342 RepID=UPI00360BA02A
MNNGILRHMVYFSLKYPVDAPETEAFLKDGERILTSITGVKEFEVLRQVSPKCDFHFGFSMEFDGQEAFETYMNHPTHQEFVQQRWETEVVKFQEIDVVKGN